MASPPRRRRQPAEAFRDRHHAVAAGCGPNVLPVRHRGRVLPVERITGRTVRSFLSSTDTEVDGLSMETFVLHPRDTTARHA